MSDFLRRVPRSLLVLLAALAFLTVSTAALAHGHPDAKSVDESHCAMCMAVHSTTHVIAVSTVLLFSGTAQTAFLVSSESFTLTLVQTLLIQDRAPPQL
jgi:hypothetical protein